MKQGCLAKFVIYRVETFNKLVQYEPEILTPQDNESFKKFTHEYAAIDPISTTFQALAT